MRSHTSAAEQQSRHRGARPCTPAEFDALYTSVRLELLRLAWLIVGDRNTAEDITQDAFLGLYTNWASLQDNNKALPYLRSSVINSSRTVLRRRRYRQALWWRVGTVTAPLPPMEEKVEVEEQASRIRDALARIAPRRREVLVLRYYTNLSYEEIAHIQGVSVGTVKSTISRGLASLAHQFGDRP